MMNRKLPSTTGFSRSDFFRPKKNPDDGEHTKSLERSPVLQASRFESRHEFGEHGSLHVTNDDFRRLGVQPEECRLTVIRRAAARSSKTIAQQQLDEPTPGGEEQLTQVATSAYRLMDPRFRIDSFQRAYVGRILPNAMMWAGRTRFAVGDDPDAKQPVTALTPDVLDDGEPFVGIDPSLPSLATGLDLRSPLTQSLDADDLINPGIVKRCWRRLQRLLRRPAFGLSAFAAVLLTVTLLANLATLAWTAQGDGQDAVIADLDNALDRQRTAQSSGPPISNGHLATPSSPNPTSPIGSVDSEFPESLDFEESAMQTAVPQAAVTESQLGKVAAAHKTPVDPSKLRATESEVEKKKDGVTLGKSEILVPAETPRKSDAANVTADFVPAQDSPVEKSTVKSEVAPIADKKKFSLPNAEEVIAARERIVGLIPSLRSPIDEQAYAQVRNELVAMQSKLDLGSPDHWAVSSFLVDLAWLSGRWSQVDEAMQSLTRYGGYDRDWILADTFASSLELANDREFHINRFRLGGVLLDDLIVAGKLVPAKRAFESVSPTAAFLNDDLSRRTVQEFAGSIAQLARLQAPGSLTMKKLPSKMTQSDAGVAGRYFCFVRRDWQQGLPLLALGTDRRLATLANQELSQGDSAPSVESIQLAHRWLACIDRAKGRDAHAIRLHVLDLLDATLPQLNGLQRLEAERTIESVSADLPFYLNRGQAQSKMQVDFANQSPVIESADTASKLASLSGRLRIDSKDQGVQIRYEPPMAITNQVIQQIARALKTDLNGCQLYFEGKFSSPKDHVVRVSISKSEIDVTHSVLIDGQQVDFADQRQVDLDIIAGEHRLAWIVSGTSFPGVFVDVKDAESGQPILLQPAYQVTATDMPTVLNISMITARPE